MKYTATYIADLQEAQANVPHLEALKGKTVLITGANGLICSALVDFLLVLNDTLQMDIRLILAARSLQKTRERYGQKLERDDVLFLQYDAMNEFQCETKPDYIIHGASPANPKQYAETPVDTMLANIIGLNNILKYAAENTTQRVLYISSSEVYGRKEGNEPFHNGEYGFVDVLNARSCYPSAKRACETLCASYREQYKVDSVIVRPGHIYGPTATRSDTRASTQFFYDVLDGHDIIMKSAGSQIRSYCYVVDCVSAILTVLLNGGAVQAYNISNVSSVITIRELAEMIANAAGKQIVFENPSDKELKGYTSMSNSSLDSEELEKLGWQGQFTAQRGITHTLNILKGQS